MYKGKDSWEEYERRKEKLKDLTQDQYEKECRKIAKELKI